MDDLLKLETETFNKLYTDYRLRFIRFAVVCRNRSGLSAAQLVVCGQAGAGSIAYRVGPALRFRCYDRFQPRTDRQFRTFRLAGRRDRLPRRRREFRGGIRRPALLFPERRER